MRSDVQALSAVQDALGLGAATIDTMYTGLNGTVDVVSSIKAKLVAARTPGVDRAKIQSEITELQKQLKNTADSAVFNGENWISVDFDLRELQRHEVGRFVVLPRRRHRQDRYALGRSGRDQALRREPGHRLYGADLPDGLDGCLCRCDRRGRQHHGNDRCCSGHQHRGGGEDLPGGHRHRDQQAQHRRSVGRASTPPATSWTSRAATTPTSSSTPPSPVSAPRSP